MTHTGHYLLHRLPRMRTLSRFKSEIDADLSQLNCVSVAFHGDYHPVIFPVRHRHFHFWSCFQGSLDLAFTPTTSHSAN